LRDAVGRARTVRIVPYSFNLSAEASKKLSRLLVDALGEKTTIETEPSIAYGKEDDWVEAQAGNLAGADQLIVLFNLSSTPEAENHGELVDRLRKHLDGEAELMVLVDDSSFMHKLRGQASAARRLDERVAAWRTVLAPCDIDPIRVSLDSTDEVDAARALEQAFLRTSSAK
jgi:hypothetical protein